MDDGKGRGRAKMPNTQTYRIAAGALAFLLVAGAGTAAMAENVASVLQRDPRFSDFVSVIKNAGLWHNIERAKAITIFAPTNDAFAPLGRNWRSQLTPVLQDIGSDDTFHSEHQTFVESTMVPGTHPEDQFRGKVTRVMAASGFYFTVDGTQPGKLAINPQPVSTEPTIGFSLPKQKTTTVGAPVAADNGLIYPTNGLAGTFAAQP
jgi:uncharacterized surface protein with fasciclin (FAS1) repeats